MVSVHHRVAAVAGHSVFYREAGVGNARTVVLLHGALASSFMFGHFLLESDLAHTAELILAFLETLAHTKGRHSP